MQNPDEQARRQRDAMMEGATLAYFREQNVGLHRRIAELEAEVERLNRVVKAKNDEWAEIRGEVERLRGALKRIRDFPGECVKLAPQFAEAILDGKKAWVDGDGCYTLMIAEPTEEGEDAQ